MKKFPQYFDEKLLEKLKTVNSETNSQKGLKMFYKKVFTLRLPPTIRKLDQIMRRVATPVWELLLMFVNLIWRTIDYTI